MGVKTKRTSAAGIPIGNSLTAGWRSRGLPGAQRLVIVPFINPNLAPEE